MASIKELKKDIRFLEQELATECLFKMILHPEIEESVLNGIAIEGVALGNELIKRANHRDGKNNPQLVKAFYKALRKDMVEKFSTLFDKLMDVK